MNDIEINKSHMNNDTIVDESQYSRQLHTFGFDAQRKISNASVLLIGHGGLIVEIAKCLILTGVKNVTIQPTKTILDSDDNCPNYYNKKNTDPSHDNNATNSKLSELNSKVEVVTLDLIDAKLIDVESYDVIISCMHDFTNNIFVNNECRKLNKKFVCAITYGLFGSVFCDFGDNFEILDPDGEQPVHGILSSVTENTFIAHEPHNLYCGDLVKITVNGESFEDTVEKILDPLTFSIHNNFLEPEQLISANFVQLKQLSTMHFKPLKKSLKDPEFTMVISDDFDMQRLLHDYYMIYCNFAYSDKNISIDQFNDNVSKLQYTSDKQKEVIKKLRMSWSGNLTEMFSIVGAIAAQEAIKSITHKYTPINQWMYCEFSDVITSIDDFKQPPGTDGSNVREMAIGVDLQQKILNGSIFVVGAGAIGCEHLKNLAMMGFSNIHVTDMDTIENSNLNRQFLFRKFDIGDFKSNCAAREASKMNSLINVTPHFNKICDDTMHIYNDDFYKQFNCVLNALDNVDARRFVDHRCVQTNTNLIDSGTLGTKCNVQVVVSDLTESYGESYDPPEKNIPFIQRSLPPD